ncbi:MAG: glycerophosphodiester phosphodiesterase family protein [Pseudomonadota bacterium]
MTLPAAFLDRPIAHRGLHGPGVPENALAAFRAALDRGYGIELDVQPSADGTAMAFHDDALDRLTTRTGPVDAQTADDLTRTVLRGSEETIPRLSDVLALVAGRVPLLIEIKDRDGAMGSAIGPLEDATLAALASYDGPVALMSFNPHSMAHIAANAPDLHRGLVTAAFDPADWPHLPDATRNRLRTIPDLDRTGAQFISHDARDLGSPRVAEIAARGLPILTWTIRSPAQEAEARRVAQNVTFEGYLP